jgi:hypothetical protein
MTAFQDKPRGDCTGERSRPTLRLSTLEAVMSVAFSYGRRGRTAAIRRGPRAARMPLFSFGETIGSGNASAIAILTSPHWPPSVTGEPIGPRDPPRHRGLLGRCRRSARRRARSVTATRRRRAIPTLGPRGFAHCTPVPRTISDPSPPRHARRGRVPAEMGISHTDDAARFGPSLAVRWRFSSRAGVWQPGGATASPQLTCQSRRAEGVSDAG